MHVKIIVTYSIITNLLSTEIFYECDTSAVKFKSFSPQNQII